MIPGWPISRISQFLLQLLYCWCSCVALAVTASRQKLLIYTYLTPPDPVSQIQIQIPPLSLHFTFILRPQSSSFSSNTARLVFHNLSPSTHAATCLSLFSAFLLRTSSLIAPKVTYGLCALSLSLPCSRTTQVLHSPCHWRVAHSHTFNLQKKLVAGPLRCFTLPCSALLCSSSPHII